MIAGQWYVQLVSGMCSLLPYCAGITCCVCIFITVSLKYFVIIFVLFLQFLFSPFLFADVHVCVCVFVVDTFIWY